MLGKSRQLLEKQIGYHPNLKVSFQRWGLRHASIFYLGSIMTSSLLIFTLVALVVGRMIFIPPGSLVQWTSILILAIAILVPILTVTSSLINWLITLWVKPRILPKLLFKDEIPAKYQTLVVIPALIANRNDVDKLVHQIEMHFLRNPEPGLHFALLTDFPDADSETLPEDEELVKLRHQRDL